MERLMIAHAILSQHLENKLPENFSLLKIGSVDIWLNLQKFSFVSIYFFFFFFNSV